MFEEGTDPSTKILVAWIGVFAAFLTGLVALISSMISQRANRQTNLELKQHQLELQNTEAKFAERLESIKSSLAEQQADRDARRDYEYEARKRLYHQYEPLLFELYEFSIGARKRIHSLARTARHGDLRVDSHGWLSVDDYYMLSTVYKLMAPLVVVKIMQRQLTLVDLSLDARIKDQYTLARCLYLTFTADFKLAKAEPRLEYDPNHEFDPECVDFPGLLAEQPTVYYRQGLSIGRLDSAVEALIVRDDERSRRCMSYGEFEEAYKKQSSDVHKKFADVIKIFLHFHPMRRPILWRILIAQLYLYKTIILNVEHDFKWDKKGREYAEVTDQERKRYDWREGARAAGVGKEKTDEAPDESILIEPFAAAEWYLDRQLSAATPV